MRALSNTRLTPHRETSSWDVRTKHVTYETIPTLDNVRGLAIYGPGATLFTLGRNNTAQQYDINSPAQLVANVQHPANLLPPSPPVSIEEQKKQGSSAAAHVEISEVPINIDISESDEDHMSPLARIAREMDVIEAGRGLDAPDRTDTLSQVSSRSRTSSRSSAASSNRGYQREYRRQPSVVSRGMSEGTTMSIGSSLHTSNTREPSVVSSRDSYQRSSVSGQSISSARSRPRGSRLRQEVLRSPDDVKIVDLFKFTKSRLSDIPYRHPQALDNTHLTNHDLRRQMLSTIFGWNGEADALIKDEMSRHPLGSANRLLLAKWLGDIDPDVMAANSESMTSSDWMLLALSGIGGHASQAKVARAYVQRLLEKGDVHTAATIMIGMGDQNDAIEIYVSHKRYMEALILTCLVFPADWQRQAELIRKWGEWAVQHSQQQLAIRCFSCTGTESSEPWTSPTAQQATFSHQSQSIPEILSPPLSPLGHRGPQRSIAKTSALKLITSFGGDKQKAKFFGLGDDDRTPIGGGVTPIAESALSPTGGDTAHTAFLRPGLRSVYHTPQSARTATPGGFSRQRLPSIGEMPSDVLPRKLMQQAAARLPTPADSGSDRERPNLLKQAHERNASQPETLQLSSSTYAPIGRPQTASPMLEKSRKINNPLPSPSPESFTVKKRDARTRNGSRDRKPDGLHIQWPPMESIITGDYMSPSPGTSVASSRYRPGTAQSATGSISESVASYSTAGAKSPMYSERSYRTVENASPMVTGPMVTGKSLDQYINSLDSAQYHVEKQQQQQRRQPSRDRQGRARSSSRKPKTRDPSEDRGRTNARYIQPAKRSPTSPVPMSPEDLRDLGAIGYGEDPRFEPRSVRDSSRGKKSTSQIRHASPEGSNRIQAAPKSRAASRNNSRRPSPEGRLTLIDTRGRSKGRDGPAMRSPSSPLPMSPQHKFYQEEEDDSADLKKAQDDKERFRSRNRSTSRMRERSIAREQSPERKRRDRSVSRQRGERASSQSRMEINLQAVRDRINHSQSVSSNYRPNELNAMNAMKDERTWKKEQAARDLEERRKSLVRRPSAPPVLHPEEIPMLSPNMFQIHQQQQQQKQLSMPDFNRAKTFPSPKLPSRSQTTSPAPLQTSQSYLRETTTTNVAVGLPATPRAMRHPKYDPEGKDIPEVPQIPEKYEPTPTQAWVTLNAQTFKPAHDTIAPLLPKTTYTAAPRRLPPRSASAPIPEEPYQQRMAFPNTLPTHPAFHAGLASSSRRRTQDPRPQADSQRVGPGSQGGSPAYPPQGAGSMGGIDETIKSHYSPPINHLNDNMTPPPPPPAPLPPMLRELQHLAAPPPPPPAPLAPLYGNQHTHSMVSGVSQGSSGVIEIVMDDDEDASDIPVIDVSSLPQANYQPPPIPSHNRGQSENDSSIAGRFSRAAERLRSASRGRPAGPIVSPQESPYESLPMWSPNRTPAATPNPSAPSNTERHPREVRAAMQEGGMI